MATVSSLPAVTLQQMLDETPTHPKIKQTLKLMTLTREKITYHALMSSTETYLQMRGLANHDQQQFNYINKMLHSKVIGVLGKIKRQQLSIKDHLQQWKQMQAEKLKEQNLINEQIIAEVQHVINNVDLPLSLFKRNDKYWYQDNPKTIEAKNYVHERIKEEKERKRKLREQQKKKEEQRQKQERIRLQKENKEQQQRKKRYHEQIKMKIQSLKKLSEQRQKNIDESEQYTASLKPLYLRIQQSHQQSNTSALEEQKKRLSQLRKLHKSIDHQQIEEHKKKLMQFEKGKQVKLIFNEPVKVSYKSKFYTSMTTRSRVQQYETTKDLYERKKQYGKIVRSDYKPKLDDKLVEEMQERLKIMARKRVRKNPKKKENAKSGDSDEQEEDEDEEQAIRKPQPIKLQSEKNNDDSDLDDEDQDDRPPKRIRGEDQDPDRKQRYQMGVSYLQHARRMAKKKNDEQSQKKQFRQQQENEIMQNENRTGSDVLQKSKTTQRYKDYLRQFVKTNRSTIDHIDTTKIKNQYNKSIIGKAQRGLEKLESETKKVQSKIQKQQELLKFKKMKNEDLISKKVEIDNAVIDTIKARLALLGK